MLSRVVHRLIASKWIDRVLINIDEPALLDDLPGIVALRDAGDVEVMKSTDSPSASVLEGLEWAKLENGPVLVTTADHALLSVDMVEHFLGQAEANGGDVNLALVSETVVRAEFPESVRTYLPFAGERYSGANLFAFLTPQARSAVEFWVQAESFRKRPWRLVSTFGATALLLFALRRLDLGAAFERISDTVGARVNAVPLPWAEAAIDVDKLSDLELVNRILAEREPESLPGDPEPGDQSERTSSVSNAPVASS